ncbi:MAG: glycerol-3-phosphate dehydrogenase/oxidase [Dehalococcoidales bacterium]|nr:glycerol-3-phosphate dehydrogenase/oxidase [Dehalococcoidales bacterium]
MKRDFSAITGKTFDLIVVGGGIIGAGIARDASLRGLKTLLLEKDDFACGTTSRSTRLIHGGFRYLQHFEFGLVREDMRERENLLKIAPHLVHPLPFLIPLEKPTERFIMSMGTLLYDILSYDKSLPGRKHYSRNKTLEMEPGLKLEGLRGSYLYYDCQIWFTERFCTENAISAAENGAMVLNHAKVIGILKNGNTVLGVKVRDMVSGKECEIASRMVVNAAGHWMDSVCGMMYGQPKRILRRTKGIHLFTPRLSNNALVLYAKSDGRLWFVIPWDKYSLIGTTDTDYTKDLDAVYAEKDDVAYLMREAQRAFPELKAEDIFYTCAGLRSLPDTGDSSPSNVSRAHKLIDHKKLDGVDGFISVLGGKITGYRFIAEEIVNLVCKRLDIKTICRTASTPLPGAPIIAENEIEKSAKESGLSLETVSHLASLYGSRYSAVLDLVSKDNRGKQALCPHSKDIVAQIWYAVHEESAITVSDFILRRSGIGFMQCQGMDAVETIAKEMGRLLGWSPEEEQRQIAEYRNTASLSQLYKV